MLIMKPLSKQNVYFVCKTYTLYNNYNILITDSDSNMLLFLSLLKMQIINVNRGAL
jgi:hypothetical protein